ncbi:MAG: pseudouridine synthase [Acidimicrobiales bacterium]
MATGQGEDGQPGAESSERLQKVLARAGLGSRRACEDVISAGRVTVNGEIAALGRRVNVARDAVAVDGVRIGVFPGLVHYLLNKPRGVVTTADDPHGRPTVTQLVPDRPRVFPVGRLDADTEGLLLMTNDGELAQHLTHPSFGVEKEYLAQVEGVPGRAALRLLRNGVDLEDGPSAPAKVGVVGEARDGVLRIVVHEGRNRQVRRMCEAVGHPVRRLVRVRVGPIALRELEPGAWRVLSAKEVRLLEVAVKPGTSPLPSARPEEAASADRRSRRSARRQPPG